MKKEPGSFLRSDVFQTDDMSEWVLQVYVGGKSLRQAGFVTYEVIYLSKGEDEETTMATITLSVLRQRDYAMDNSRFDSVSFQSPVAMNLPVGEEFAIDNFMNTSDLEERFIHRDSVLFSLDVEVLGKAATLSRTMPAFLGHLSTLHDDLYDGLLTNAKSSYSDITIIVEQKNFFLHKCILAARSPYFKLKFKSLGFNTKLLFQGSLTLTDLDTKVFQEVVCFIYTDECSNTMLATRGLSLLKAAAHFELPKLIQICEDYIGESLTPIVVVAVFNVASESKLDRLSNCCSEFIAVHLNNILATKTLQDLHPDALKELIARSVIPTHSLQGLSNLSPQQSVTSQLKSEKGEEEKVAGSWTDIQSIKVSGGDFSSHEDDVYE